MTRRARGFTLIELLVVISIIGLLVGILLPVLASSRESARTTQCTSGMRQWAIALAGYATDSRDSLPQRGQFAGSISPTPVSPLTAYAGARLSSAWYNALPEYIGAQKYGSVFAGSTTTVTRTDEHGRDVIDPAITNPATQLIGANAGFQLNWIYYCPSAVYFNRASSGGAGPNGANYGMNGVLTGGGFGAGDFFPSTINYATGTAPRERRFANMNRIQNPAITLFMAESFNASAVTPIRNSANPLSTGNGNSVVRFRHNSNANLPFANQQYASPTNPSIRGSANYTMLDGSTRNVDGREVDDPYDNTGSVPAGALNFYRQSEPDIVWGPF